MSGQEHRIDRHALPIDNACDLRRIVGVDKDIVCMKIIMPNDTTSDTLAMRDDMAVNFEEILQNRQLRFVGWVITAGPAKYPLLAVLGEGSEFL